MVYGYELKVDFAQKGAVAVEKSSRGAGKAGAARTKDVAAKKKTAPRKRA